MGRSDCVFTPPNIVPFKVRPWNNVKLLTVTFIAPAPIDIVVPPPWNQNNDQSILDLVMMFLNLFVDVHDNIERTILDASRASFNKEGTPVHSKE